MVNLESLIVGCIVSLFALLYLLRRGRPSLGLPIAYLYSLLLNHVPGAFAHVEGRDFLMHSDFVESAMKFTTIGSICFVIGVWLAQTGVQRTREGEDVERRRFWLFCLFAGWTCFFVLIPLYNIPSFNAVGEKGSAVWMLGVLLGLRYAVRRGKVKDILLWCAALTVFPAVMLVFAGFMSYGSAAVIVVCSALVLLTRRYWHGVLAIVLFTYVSMSIFVNYFDHRNEIRKQVWGGAPLDVRIDTVVNSFTDFQLFDPSNREQLIYLDRRLNQNFFVGLAARRIDDGQVSYLKGESLWEGLLALVPRIFWPDKPVYGGSPKIVSKMTGIQFNSQTSIGVGNVMEFQINFGTPGVVCGFLALGWLIGILDLKAATAERRGDLNKLLMFFLPCLALVQPGSSLVELCGGAAAAFVAAFIWSLVWKRVIAGKSDRWRQMRPISWGLRETSPYKQKSIP